MIANFHQPRYKMKKELRRTYKGVETIIPEGAIVTPIQEKIHYQKRTHRVQIVYKSATDGVEIAAWVHRRILGVMR